MNELLVSLHEMTDPRQYGKQEPKTTYVLGSPCEYAERSCGCLDESITCRQWLRRLAGRYASTRGLTSSRLLIALRLNKSSLHVSIGPCCPDLRGPGKGVGFRIEESRVEGGNCRTGCVRRRLEKSASSAASMDCFAMEAVTA